MTEMSIAPAKKDVKGSVLFAENTCLPPATPFKHLEISFIDLKTSQTQRPP